MSKQDHEATSDQHADGQKRDQVKQRREKLDKLRESGFNYPNDARPTHLAATMTHEPAYADATQEDLLAQKIAVTVAGRMMTRRLMGKASFFNIQDRSGQIQIYARSNDLPEGVTMHAPPMPANMSVMPVVFEATADAPIAGKLMKFQGKHIDPATGIAGHFKNRADLVVAAPGQSLYVYKDVEQLPIAVVDKLPFRLEIVQPKVPIVQNGEMALKVLPVCLF